jgi:hypothetical protein
MIWHRERREKPQTPHQINEGMVARWSRNVGWFTFALVIVNFVTAYIFWHQLNVMQGQLQEMKVDQRPWVSASQIALVGSLVHDDSGEQMTMRFSLKNTGHSPARRVFPSFLPSFSGWGPQATRKLCAEAEKSFSALAIFPGDTVVQATGAKIPEREFLNFREDLKNGKVDDVNGVLPSIGACIAYQDMDTEKFHHTPYSFYISLAGRDASPLRMMIEQASIPTSALMLVSMPMETTPD